MDDESSDDRFVAFGKLLKDGHELLDKGDDRFTSSEIDPEEMKILLLLRYNRCCKGCNA